MSGMGGGTNGVVTDSGATRDTDSTPFPPKTEEDGDDGDQVTTADLMAKQREELDAQFRDHLIAGHESTMMKSDMTFMQTESNSEKLFNANRTSNQAQADMGVMGVAMSTNSAVTGNLVSKA